MSFGQGVFKKLSAVNTPPAQAGSENPLTVHHRQLGAQIQVDLWDRDAYSIVMTAARIETAELPVSARMPALIEQSKSLDGNLDFLGERLILVEIDRNLRQALLRSEKPVQTGGMRAYFECVLRDGNQLRFGRYQQVAGKEREPGLCVLPETTFQRLIDTCSLVMLAAQS